jgi:hypothetical protein
MRLPGRYGVMACVAMLAACSDATGADGRRDIADARRLWDSRDVDDYRMTVQLGGAWIGGAAVIQVRDGVPVSVQPVGEQTLPPEAFGAYDTVEELFAVLDNAVENDADRIDATFHDRLGIPLEVYIDVRTTWADDEHGFAVESFQLQ